MGKEWNGSEETTSIIQCNRNSSTKCEIYHVKNYKSALQTDLKKLKCGIFKSIPLQRFIPNEIHL